MEDAWTLRRDGRDHAVVGGAGRATTLLVDGAPVDQGTAGYWESVTLEHDDVAVRVQWGPRNTITKVVATIDDTEVPLAPPPGSSAERRDRLALDHPRLHVARRVGIALAEIVVGVLGVGALVGAFVRGLLPRVSWDWLPDVSWPDWLRAPDWFRYLDPFHWLAQLGLSWPDPPAWLVSAWDTVTPTAKFWVPLLVAAAIGYGEVRKRREQETARLAQRDEPSSPSDETDTPTL